MLLTSPMKDLTVLLPQAMEVLIENSIPETKVRSAALPVGLAVGAPADFTAVLVVSAGAVSPEEVEAAEAAANELWTVQQKRGSIDPLFLYLDIKQDTFYFWNSAINSLISISFLASLFCISPSSTFSTGILIRLFLKRAISSSRY